MSSCANDPTYLTALAAALLAAKKITERQHDIFLYVDLHNYSVVRVRKELYPASVPTLYRELAKARFAIATAIAEQEEGETRMGHTLQQGHHARTGSDTTAICADRLLGLQLVTTETAGAQNPLLSAKSTLQRGKDRAA